MDYGTQVIVVINMTEETTTTIMKYPWNAEPCTLCGESHGDTMLYCGGPVSLICPRCRTVVDKYMELREEHLERWERVLEARRIKEQELLEESSNEN